MILNLSCNLSPLPQTKRHEEEMNKLYSELDTEKTLAAELKTLLAKREEDIQQLNKQIRLVSFIYFVLFEKVCYKFLVGESWKGNPSHKSVILNSVFYPNFLFMKFGIFKTCCKPPFQKEEYICSRVEVRGHKFKFSIRGVWDQVSLLVQTLILTSLINKSAKIQID